MDHKDRELLDSDRSDMTYVVIVGPSEKRTVVYRGHVLRDTYRYMGHNRRIYERVKDTWEQVT